MSKNSGWKKRRETDAYPFGADRTTRFRSRVAGCCCLWILYGELHPPNEEILLGPTLLVLAFEIKFTSFDGAVLKFTGDEVDVDGESI